MSEDYKYDVGFVFYIQSADKVFNKVHILKRERINYETRPSKVFYLLQIEKKGVDWYTETFIDLCKLTEKEMKKRKRE